MHIKEDTHMDTVDCFGAIECCPSKDHPTCCNAKLLIMGSWMPKSGMESDIAYLWLPSIYTWSFRLNSIIVGQRSQMIGLIEGYQVLNEHHLTLFEAFS